MPEPSFNDRVDRRVAELKAAGLGVARAEEDRARLRQYAHRDLLKQAEEDLKAAERTYEEASRIVNQADVNAIAARQAVTELLWENGGYEPKIEKED